jgi:hypothetical protein
MRLLAAVAGFTTVTLLGTYTDARDANTGAGTTPGPAAEGRRLLKEGKVAEAAVKLRDAWNISTSDPEVLFDLADCYERLGRTSEALVAFRTYLEQPTALRLRAADDRIRILRADPESGPPAATSGPRRVIVPKLGNGEACFRQCIRTSPCVPRRQPHCATQFACLRTCPGARVEPGLCATARIRPGERCQTEDGAL